METARLLTIPSLLLAVVTAAVTAAPVAAAPAAGEDTPTPSPGQLVDLGEPITQVLSHDQALGFGPDGEPQAYFVVGGNAHTPAEFAVVDIRTRQTVLDVRLPRGDTSWAVDYSAQEKAVYAGISSTSGAGELYRHKVGTDTVESLGVPLPGERIWTVDAAPDGVVFAGTYPGGRLFSYTPDTGEVHDYGQLIAGEGYVRGLETTKDTVWFGTQPGAELAALDRASGAVTRIPLPEPYASWTAATVYDIYQRGDRLFVRVTTTGASALLVYDIPSGSWVDSIADPGTRAVSPVDPADGRTVYFRLSTGRIVGYDIVTLTTTDIAWAPNAIPGDFAWIDMNDPQMPGLSLSFTYYYGRIYALNLATRKGYYHQAQVQGAANPLTAVAAGPDGAVYFGGFLSPPGMSRFDPATGRFELLRGAGQVEGYGVFGDRLVYGRYPGGKLYSFDPARRWSMGSNPGPGTVIGDSQDRPKAFGRYGDEVVVGSVPATGELGGALSVWHPATGAIEVHRGVVPHQSPVSVAVRDEVAYVGTSIWGGYGVDPVAIDAVLIGWDPATGRVLHSTVPVPGADAVSGLTFGPDGNLYGVADGRLFVFDPRRREVLRTVRLSETDRPTRYGDEEAVRFVAGRLFAAAEGAVWHVDTVTWQVTPLVTGARVDGLTADPAGDLYFIGRDTRAYRYDLAADTTAPQVTAVTRPAEPRHAALVELTAADAGIGLRAVQYRVDGGQWHRYEHPFAVTGAGDHTVEYRAVDHAFNASPTGTVALHL